jgi:hypothetical protein
MKKISKVILIVFALVMVFNISVLAAEKYTVSEKTVLENFDELDDATVNMFGGSSAWGAHWVDTAISETDGLSGSKALLLKFAEYADGMTLGGLQSNSIGITGSVNDWTKGKALLFRVKNLSDTGINMLASVDVSDGAGGRVRTMPKGTQKLLDLNLVETGTVYADALANDGKTYADGSKSYVVVPAGFDGYYIWNIGDYSILDTKFEGIYADNFSPDYSQVVDFVMLFQDCSGKSLVIDEFKLVDYTASAIAETESAAETANEEASPAVPAAATADTIILSAAVVMFAAAIAVAALKKIS